MNRRDFIVSALAGVGFVAVSGAKGRLLAQQTEGTPPLAILAADLPGGRIFLRAYQGPGRGRYWVMARRDGRDHWFRVNFPGEMAPVLRGFAQQGSLEAGMEVTNSLLQFEIQMLRGGSDFNLRLRTPQDGVVEGTGTSDGPPDDDDAPTGGGGTQALGFFGALVAIVAILSGTVIAGMAMGYESDFKLKTRGGFDIDFDVTKVPNEPDGGGDGFMHDPICDTMPPINC